MDVDSISAAPPAYAAPDASQESAPEQVAGGRTIGLDAASIVPLTLTIAAFVALFAKPFYLLVRDWWNLPEAGHGLLLAPVAIWLAWRAGITPEARPNRVAGLALLALAVVVRDAAGLAAELFTMRGSMIVALAALTIYQFGFRQLMRWWLPFVLLCLSIPLPEIITQTLALPLQFRASRMGAALLEMRSVPVRLSGNVILLPGRQLFVTEACSGLRSLTALLSMAVLLGALMLRTPVSRIALVAAAIPVAIVINGIRVFLTGFLVYFVSPSFGEGFMHVSEGWLLFIVSFAILGAFTWLGGRVEQAALRWRSSNA